MTPEGGEPQQRDFPSMIVRALEALGDKNRREILIHLKNKGALAYSELQVATSLEKGTLNHHLERLMAGALIRNYRGESPANQYSSFYELSSIGGRLIENILESFGPSERILATTSSASGIAPYRKMWAVCVSTTLSATENRNTTIPIAPIASAGG
jgi:DNA-binding transcriptional ArsR family regulator